VRRATPLPIAALDAVLLAMIEQHAGRPCPTRRDIIGWTGILPRRRIRAYLEDMQARGLIEIEVDAIDRRRRRLRVADGAWTAWTARHERHNRAKAA
jgi:DNA-binding MarR family transcriptional regulator